MSGAARPPKLHREWALDRVAASRKRCEESLPAQQVLNRMRAGQYLAFLRCGMGNNAASGERVGPFRVKG